MLRLHDLHKRFGDVVALDGSDLLAEPGRIVGFLGPNGAGKTTTMRSVFGLVGLDAGEVAWHDEPITDAARLRFGYLPEERGLYPRMGIARQLTYFGRLHGLATGEAEDRANDWLERFGLADRAGDRVDQLSHGNQQRVQLAASLLHEPELLVLDEPFVGLDPLGVDRMVEVLREQAERGVAVVFSSHQLDLVEHLVDDVTIIAGGRTRVQGTLETVREAATERIVRIRPERPDDLELPPGARVERREGDDVLVAVPADDPPGPLLRAAEAAGGVRAFVFEPTTLAEVFRQVVGATVAQLEAELMEDALAEDAQAVDDIRRSDTAGGDTNRRDTDRDDQELVR